MASNVTVQSVLSKISQDHLECSICSCCFKEPKMLDCLHSFCLKCLQELRQHQKTGGTKLTCPLCRRDTQLKRNDVAALPNNFTLGALVDEFTMQEQLLKGQGSEIKCQNCEEENEAISRCSDCNNFLCLECNKAHGRMAKMKHHVVNTLEKLRSGEISYRSKLREQVPKCGKHPDQNVTIYCNTCEQLACTTCSVLDHAKHSLSGQTEAWGRCKCEIAALTAKAELKKRELVAATEGVKNMRKALDRVFAETKYKIDQKIRDRVARMYEEGHVLKEKAEGIYKVRVMTLETAQATNSKEASHAEQKLDEMKGVIDQASCHEILDLKPKLVHNFKELTAKTACMVPEGSSFLDFEGNDMIFPIGRLVSVSEDDQKPILSAQAAELSSQGPSNEMKRCQKKTEIHKFGENKTKFEMASDVAVFSNNEVVILDEKRKHLIGFLPKTLQSPAVSKELKIPGVRKPRRVAVNKADLLVVLVGPFIKTFNREYHRFSDFKPGICRRPNSHPTCLAVDDNNLIAVGYEKEEEISLHNLDGTLITILSSPGIGDYLTSHKQRLIYTDQKAHKLHSIDYSGREVFTTDISTIDRKGSARGVCNDKDGNIYVVIHCLCESDEIHYFDPKGTYMGRVIKGFKHARSLALAPNSDLVVVEESSVALCRHV
ncbi:E3 ubiquitin-protein ligase TRIM71-like isoform X2 [Acanthaster planci]|nr:E3 ubiquitin-protein ligase TRIM71-like isoform X2 [Acanthaster planci]XP_022108456.1 E3 ubiquitin-protein ligase TRIM71-like isoform X2 [Acanthaster planci]